MKKKILTIGAIGGIIAPVAGMVSCGGDGVKHYNLLPTYTGEADQLIALGIGADYYPLQLNEKNPYGYLTNPGKYMVVQTPEFKEKFSKRIKQLMPKVKGTSWWNQQALNSDEQGSDPAYWQKMEGSLLLYEHYLLDDDEKIIDNSKAPKHKNEAVVQTNFRSSRDPYTRIPKGVFYGWDLTDNQLNTIISSGNSKNVVVNNETVSIGLKAAKIIKKLRELEIGTDGKSSWTYNDKYFVDSFHRMFLDNKDFQDSKFVNWLIDSSKESPFTSNADGMKATSLSNQIQNLFDASTFRQEEVKIGIGPRSTLGGMPGPKHHPIYEQQEGEVGAAPMFEGAMRDNQLYLFNVAWQIDNLVTFGTPYGKQHLDKLPDTILASERNSNKKIAQSKEEANKVVAFLEKNLTQKQVASIKSAFENANKITEQLWKRIANLKIYFDALKNEVGQKSPLKFGLFTIAPGHGESTLQTMSKYSFIYRELGFAQPIPSNISDLAKGAKTYLDSWRDGENDHLSDGKIRSKNIAIENAIGKDSLFNMDDNGWFWTLGAAGKLSTKKMEYFKSQFDLGVIASRNTDFDADISNSDTNALPAANMFNSYKTTSNAKTFLQSQRVNYDLWNEGLKTPFVMHMILDKIQDKMEKWAVEKDPNIDLENLKSKRDDATSWGNYFSNEYIEGI